MSASTSEPGSASPVERSHLGPIVRGAILGGMLGAIGIGAAWACVNALDPDWERLLVVGAFLCPAGAVCGACVGAYARGGIAAATKVGAVVGGASGLIVAGSFFTLITIAEEFHPYAIFGLPPILLAITVGGALWGGAFGLVYCGCRAVVIRLAGAERDREEEAACARRARRFTRGTLAVAGVWGALLGLCLVVGLVRLQIRLTPVRRLEALGGHLHQAAGYVRLDRNVGDAELPRFVELLNEIDEVRRWEFLDLSTTQVTGAGLAHLSKLSKDQFTLAVSIDPLDEVGLANLHALGGKLRLQVVGLASDETCASIRQALPDVQSFEFQRPAEPVRIPKPTQPMPPPAGIEGVITNSIGMKLAWIGQGEFMMGSPNTESLRAGNEYYRHVRVADPFYLGVYEVTQEEYENVMGENPSYFSPGGQGGTALSGLDTRRFPADSVSWQDAAEFCRRLSARPEERAAGREYRLPTEVDWEYACRAGTTTPTHFGDSLSSAQANFDGDHPYSTTQKGPSLQRTTTAGSYTPNGFGLHNMHGNVCEWCVDWEGSYQHVYRGGSWADTGAACRAAAIRCAMPTQRDNRLGFRVVCETPGSQP